MAKYKASSKDFGTVWVSLTTSADAEITYDAKGSKVEDQVRALTGKETRISWEAPVNPDQTIVTSIPNLGKAMTFLLPIGDRRTGRARIIMTPEGPFYDAVLVEDNLVPYLGVGLGVLLAGGLAYGAKKVIWG